MAGIELYVIDDRVKYDLAWQRLGSPGLERGKRCRKQIQRTSDVGLIGLGLA